MKRIYAAVLGLFVVLAVVGLTFFAGHDESSTQRKEGTPVYAYADVEHIMMSHPKYSTYHRLELEYNAMVAQYQFEQWNYSHKAAAEGMSSEKFASVEAAGTAALQQELQAKIALKENELNHMLQQEYEKLLQQKKREQPMITKGNALKIVNLQLKLQNLSLTDDEKEAAMAEYRRLMKEAGTTTNVTTATAEEINAEMAPHKEKAKAELEAYAKSVKEELEKRQAQSRNAFQMQLKNLQNRPEPSVWNKQWKEKLNQKESEMNAVKESMMADIRNKASEVAQEQGIDMIFGDYESEGTALDVTDDIIAKLA